MFVRHLTLSDYRSWPVAEVPLTEGVNVLVGRNGAGKTNLAEALGFLATLSSHRVSSDAPLVRRGAGQAVVRAAVVSAGRELVLEVEINSGRANRARINRSPLPRASGLLGVLRTVLFAPEDLSLVRGDPSDRRRFLDELLVMRTPRLAGVRRDYERILKQRSALLKSAGPARRGGDLSTLDVWDSHLAEVGGHLVAARTALVEELRPYVLQAYAALAPESAPIDVRYRSVLAESAPDTAGLPLVGGPTAAPVGEVGAADDATAESAAEVWAAALLAEMGRRRHQELDRGVCLVGPHRDDLDLVLGDGPAKGYASHGESWSFALALRLGGFGLLRSDGVDPVLVLDDVFAELDSTRRIRLAEMVRDADQVVITAAVEDDVPSALAGRLIRIRSEVQEQGPTSFVVDSPVAAGPALPDPPGDLSTDHGTTADSHPLEGESALTSSSGEQTDHA